VKKASTIETDSGFHRDKALENYLSALNPTNLQHDTTVISTIEENYGCCPICDTEMFFNETFLDCPDCGYREYILVDSEKPSYKDPPREMSYYAYKKINHLNEILNQFQAKESTIIPEDVMNEVILEIRKRRITNIADLTEEDIRQILKKLNRSKYYEHRAHILSRLNGNPPPTITPEIEEKIRTMFQDIQAPFLLYCPNDRTNFLSYSYILYKFFELLELDEYKVFFPLLKSRDRLIAHDTIWAKICEYLHWEFIRSV
jgi:integrase